MCFQNLLLGVPVFVVLAKNIPLESAVCSPAEDVSWGGNVLTLRKKKTQCSEHFPVFAIETR